MADTPEEFAQRDHPGYGPCDGFGPAGSCSQCTGLAERGIDGKIIDLYGDEVAPNLPTFIERQAAEITALRAEIEALRATAWRPWPAPEERNIEIWAYRPDAGVFEAWFVAPCDHADDTDDDTPAWFTTRGEDLTGDLPTHWTLRVRPSPPAER